jgi:hypothetical protein
MAGPAACPAQSRLTPFRHSVVQIGALKRWEASARSPYEALSSTPGIVANIANIAKASGSLRRP